MSKARTNRPDDPNRSGNSRYAKKIQRKHGRGRIDQAWQWWFYRGSPEEAAICTPSSLRQAATPEPAS